MFSQPNFATNQTKLTGKKIAKMQNQIEKIASVDDALKKGSLAKNLLYLSQLEQDRS